MAVLDPIVRHLYVHVPFCPSICPFCSFEVSLRTPGVVERYFDRLATEAVEVVAAFDHRLDTIYFGGGTPSFLRAGEFARLVDIVRESFGWAAEVTLEVHPSTVASGRVAAWLDAGVTRLSVGVESFDDAVLGLLGRGHDADTSRRALDRVLDEAARYDVIVSADVMTAIDGQDVAAELTEAAASGVDHVSAYALTIEAGTPFERDGVEVDPDVEFDAFEIAEQVLSAQGLLRYEVSNHARPGAQCRHNQAYWANSWWSALGPGASSHLPMIGSADQDTVALRTMSPPLAAWLDGTAIVVDPRDRFGYVVDGILAGLRRADGVDIVELGDRIGMESSAVKERFADAVATVTADPADSTGPLATFDGRRLCASHSGVRVLDRITAAFVAAAGDR